MSNVKDSLAPVLKDIEDRALATTGGVWERGIERIWSRGRAGSIAEFPKYPLNTPDYIQTAYDVAFFARAKGDVLYLTSAVRELLAAVEMRDEMCTREIAELKVENEKLRAENARQRALLDVVG